MAPIPSLNRTLFITSIYGSSCDYRWGRYRLLAERGTGEAVQI